MRQPVELNEEQAVMLANLRAAMVAAKRDHDLVFAAIAAGHGITSATAYELTGTTLVAEVPDAGDA